MTKNIDNKDLDDILESVLEDFEEEQKVVTEQKTEVKVEVTTQSTTSTTATTTSPSTTSNNNLQVGKEIEELRKMMESLAHGDTNQTLDELFQQFGGNGEFPAELSGSLPDLDKETEESLKKLMDEFQANPQMQEIMEGMMEKLVSKDVLYEPIKEMREQYPPWLEANKDKISKEDLEKYQKQFNIIDQICVAYEADPNNTTKLVQLIQLMQETGQPPAEIMQGIAPDMDLKGLQEDKNCSIM